MVLELILTSLYFFLPAYLANMAPVLFKWLPWGDKPIQEKLFGRHKTWRGLIIGTLTGTLLFALQQAVYNAGWKKLALIDYYDFSLLLGFLLALGALLGDLVKSYYKRKAGIAPGQPWIPFDQMDFVFGGLILGFFVYVPPSEVVLVLMIISPLLHLIVNYLGFLLGINKTKI